MIGSWKSYIVLEIDNLIHTRYVFPTFCVLCKKLFKKNCIDVLYSMKALDDINGIPFFV